MPYLSDHTRCIAIDLIGMGDSEKLEDRGENTYSYHVQKEYFDACLKELGVEENVTFAIHDWGSALGFHWSNDHRDSVKGVCYMEAIVEPLHWENWPEDGRSIFQGFRSEAGEELVLKKNFFVEGVLPSAIIRDLDSEEMEVYRRPYLGELDRRPTLDWPRQIPIDDEPREVCEIVKSYGKWMAENEIPKLFINAEPGAILVGKQRDFCRTWKNQTEISVKGNHFIQEDSPHEIGEAILNWYKTL